MARRIATRIGDIELLEGQEIYQDEYNNIVITETGTEPTVINNSIWVVIFNSEKPPSILQPPKEEPEQVCLCNEAGGCEGCH